MSHPTSKKCRSPVTWPKSCAGDRPQPDRDPLLGYAIHLIPGSRPGLWARNEEKQLQAEIEPGLVSL
jgi:hypothetical protein